MNESAKTMTFVGVAAALVVFAMVSNYMNQPKDSGGFEMVGKPFFEEFNSANKAQSLEVVVVDPETAESKRFSVENKKGLWRIPSHYNYPAEAAARLATTASSVIGIERDSLAGRLPKEHERLGVVDPLGDEVDDPESVGKRITLKDKDGDVLVDYIIGKEAEVEIASDSDAFAAGDSNEKFYYVRRPDENQTYMVKLNVDLSAKFSDWIDPDLLRLDQSDLTRISIDNYEIEENRANPLGMIQGLTKAQGDRLDLSRPSNTEPWQLGGLNAEQEELNKARLNELIGVLDELKIAGVRPKYKYKGHLLLTPDLKLNNRPEFADDPDGLNRAAAKMQSDLEDKGFSFSKGADGGLALVSQNGEMELGTRQGLVYTLHVGKPVEGDEEEIEIGLNRKEMSDEKKTESTSESGDEKKSDSEEGDEDKSEEVSAEETTEEVINNRYLMVRVGFDESLLDAKPIEPAKPVAPEKPENYEPVKENKEAEPKADNADVEAPPTEGGGDQENAAENDETESQEPERNPESVKYDADLIAYEQAKVEYEVAISNYEAASKTYAKSIENGNKAADELNERFGDWFYVISANNLNTLKTERKDIVNAKELPPGAAPEVPARPNISFPDIPGLDAGQSEPEKEEMPKTESESSEASNDAGGKSDAKNEAAEDPVDEKSGDSKVNETEGGESAEKPASESEEKKSSSEKETDQSESAKSEGVTESSGDQKTKGGDKSEGADKFGGTEKPKDSGN